MVSDNSHYSRRKGRGHSHTKSISHIDGSSGSLQDTKRPNDGGWHPILGLVNTKVLEGTLGLRSPIFVGRDLNLAKGIALGSGVGGHSHGGGVNASLEL